MSEECGICFEPCYGQIHGCKHPFCGQCINEWYLKSNDITCPTCRSLHPSGINLLIELRCAQAFRVLSLIHVFQNVKPDISRMTFRKKGLSWHPKYNSSFDEAMISFKKKTTKLLDSISCTVHLQNRVTRSDARKLFMLCNPESLDKCWEMKEKGLGAIQFYNECLLLFKVGLDSKWWNENWDFTIVE